MRAFIVGAGLTAPAGYPTSADLFSRMRDNLRQMQVGRVNPARWQEFDAWWNGATWLQTFFPRHPDSAGLELELLLTLMDVQIAAVEQRADEIGKEWFRKILNGKITTPAESEEAFHPAQIINTAAEPLKRARKILTVALQQLIERLDDSTASAPYLTRFVDHLGAGDAVITLNYDREIEKVLASAGWTRIDQSLAPGPALGWESPNRSRQISLLKLHGSVDWLMRSDGQVFENYATMPPLGLPATPYGQAAQPYDPDNRPALIEPTYLKSLNNQYLSAIWAKAASALAVASDVAIVGYSFPLADISMRGLVTNSLRLRPIVPTIIDISNGPADALSTLLSRSVNHIDDSAENWCNTLPPRPIP